MSPFFARSNFETKQKTDGWQFSYRPYEVRYVKFPSSTSSKCNTIIRVKSSFTLRRTKKQQRQCRRRLEVTYNQPPLQGHPRAVPFSNVGCLGDGQLWEIVGR